MNGLGFFTAPLPGWPKWHVPLSLRRQPPVRASTSQASSLTSIILGARGRSICSGRPARRSSAPQTSSCPSSCRALASDPGSSRLISSSRCRPPSRGPAICETACGENNSQTCEPSFSPTRAYLSLQANCRIDTGLVRPCLTRLRMCWLAQELLLELRPVM